MCANMLRGIGTCLNMSWDKPMTRVRSVGASERREACVGGRRRTSAWSAFLCEFSTKLRDSATKSAAVVVSRRGNVKRRPARTEALLTGRPTATNRAAEPVRVLKPFPRGRDIGVYRYASSGFVICVRTCRTQMGQISRLPHQSVPLRHLKFNRIGNRSRRRGNRCSLIFRRRTRRSLNGRPVSADHML